MQAPSEDSRPQFAGMTGDEVYLRIMDNHERWTGIRWTVTSFFLSVSFALFGFSLQYSGPSPDPQLATAYRLAERLAALGLYWFTYLLFRRYDDWSKHLRRYMEALEKSGATSVRLQERWKSRQSRFRRLTSVGKLLFYFGLLYAAGVVMLWVLGM